jgi:HEXXH motif-containing protein
MVDIEAYYRGFSCPQYGLDEAFLALALTHDARAIGRAHLARYGAGLERRGRNLGPLLAQWLQNDLSPNASWHPAIGLAEEGLTAGSAPDYLGAGAALGLLASQFGAAGEWELELDAPRSLQWDRWRLPPACRLRVAADGQTASVCSVDDHGETIVCFERRADEWQTSALQPAPQLRLPNGKITLLLEPFPDDPALDALQGSLLPDAAVPAVTERFHRCIALLANCAPEYLAWIGRVLRFVIPLASDSQATTSGSRHFAPGLIHVSADDRPAALAELLVHEASHQYFLILRRLGPVDDGSDKRLHYSPLTDAGRPLERILLGYHAFANILLLYRRLEAAGPAERAYCRDNEAGVRAKLEQLHAVLAASTALTPRGRAIWEPLVARL